MWLSTHHVELRTYTANLVHQQPRLVDSQSQLQGNKASPPKLSSPRRPSMFDRFTGRHQQQRQQEQPSSAYDEAVSRQVNVANTVDRLMRTAQVSSIDDKRWADFIVNIPFTLVEEPASVNGAQSSPRVDSAAFSQLRDVHAHSDPHLEEYLRQQKGQTSLMSRSQDSQGVPHKQSTTKNMSSPALVTAAGNVHWKRTTNILSQEQTFNAEPVEVDGPQEIMHSLQMPLDSCPRNTDGDRYTDNASLFLMLDSSLSMRQPVVSAATSGENDAASFRFLNEMITSPNNSSEPPINPVIESGDQLRDASFEQHGGEQDRTPDLDGSAPEIIHGVGGAEEEGSDSGDSTKCSQPGGTEMDMCLTVTDSSHYGKEMLVVGGSLNEKIQDTVGARHPTYTVPETTQVAPDLQSSLEYSPADGDADAVAPDVAERIPDCGGVDVIFSDAEVVTVEVESDPSIMLSVNTL
jgi:hypothetical protein